MGSVVGVTWKTGAPALTCRAPTVRVGGVILAGDARLDDEAAVADRLGTSVRGLALVARAYMRWGQGFAEQLTGDYAVVVVDPDTRMVLAARDPFGVRRLAYRRLPRGIAFAADPGALAALGTPSAEVDESTVWAFLTGGATTHEQTFFRTVSRVPPGHVLIARESTVDVRRYFFPPVAERKTSRAETLDAFRAQLETSVRDRLRSERPVIVEVSGGLDSGSLACVADAVRGSGDVHFFNGRFREADEQRFVAAIDAQLRTRIQVSDAEPTSALDEPIDPGGPGGYPLVAMTRALGALAARTGARSVLSGTGGDELLFERGVYRDLASSGRFATLWRETGRAHEYSTRTRRFYLRDALRSLVPLRGFRRGPRPPEWLRMSAPRHAPRERDLAWDWSSETQRFTWEWLTSPRLVASLEALDRLTSAAQLEIRYPFLDTRLAAVVLSTPYIHRMPGGRMKVLLRDALTGVLPEQVRERTHVTTFDAAILASMAKKLRALREVLERGPWRSEPYVDRARAAALLRCIDGDPPDLAGAITAWNIAMLELWLRAIV